MESVIRFFQPPNKSFFLFGPRGTGKSTLIKALFPNAIIIDLLKPEAYRSYSAFPERLRELVMANENNHTFIIDEVQKIPTLLDVVHELIEMKKGWHFILTGSSSRKLKKEGVNLLAGRAQKCELHPFMASEIKGDFSIESALTYGMLPLIKSSPSPKEDLSTYIALYMREEVVMEGIVRNVEHFSRFLEAISFSQGSVLNYSSIARDCHISSKTVENYIGILEDLLLSFKLPVFNKKAKRNLISHSKFYYFDAGVYRSIRPTGPLDLPAEIDGLALETLVIQSFKAWLAYSSETGSLYFWRTKSGLEVDLVVYGETQFCALEIKNSNKVRPEDLRGLRAFKEDYPESRCILLYRGSEKFIRNNVLCFPVSDFLKSLLPNKPIPK